MITRNLLIYTAAFIVTAGTSMAQVNATWDYDWDRATGGFPGGSDDGGRWNSLSMSMSTQVIDNGPNPNGSSFPRDYSWVKNNSFNISATLGNWDWGDVDALFLVITNNPAAPTTTDADWTALYLDGNGNFYATEYANAPTSTHSFTPFMTGTYSKTSTGSGTGTETTFSLAVSEAQLAQLATGNGAANWEGFGYPFDNDGDTAGNQFTPYRMGLWGRAYLDGALTVSSGSKGVTWQVDNSGRIGTIDLVTDFDDGPTSISPVPESSSAALLALGLLSVISRRKR